MSTRTEYRRRNEISRLILRAIVFVPFCVVAAFGFVPRSNASERDDLAFRDHLAAGEFGPAREIADRADTPAERDRRVREIAAAQAVAGAYRASLGTALDISDGAVRQTALSELRSLRLPPSALRGGGPQADFDSLIELITTTVEPDSWDDVGGPGSLHEFDGGGGVFVDASGVMHRIDAGGATARLSEIRDLSRDARGPGGDVHTASALRKVSLPRLEKQLQRLWVQGRGPDDAMRNLAGLQDIQYLLVYPETGDLVVAGPAGDWYQDQEGRSVSVDTGRPVMQLDDLVVVFQNSLNGAGRFGCSITPRKENLARTRSFLDASAKTPLRPGRRPSWLRQLRECLGNQDIEVYGIDPRTRAARVIVEADHHMKLIGMGLAEGVLGVTSYLDSIQVAEGESPPPLGLLRWWFTLDYDAIHATSDGNAFELRGSGVRVKSENELLTELGERVHTGTSEELNLQFAHSFTRHFDELAIKYPVYGELRNVFDLAMVAALIKAHDLTGRVQWQPVHFLDSGGYQTDFGIEPKEVASVINHRVINRRHIVAGVSGGVAVNARLLVSRLKTETDQYELPDVYRAAGTKPQGLDADQWWWD